MVRRLLVTALAVSVPIALMFTGPVAHAERSEQVVFSGEGEGSLGEVEFWIWCQAESDNPYEEDCNGAMRFDDLSKKGQHVTGDSSEGAEGQYTMDVASADGSIACTLTNEPPIVHGPHNTIDIVCSSPSGTATSTDAVVTNNG
ncbi:MAG TPA: hypothetical protein VKA30_03080 [Actinomycetota bacterium]|nr:hypothetical protein [Actinomycetota bacterium]